MTDDRMAHRPLTRQALIDCGWQHDGTGWWAHPDLPGWTVSRNGTPVLLASDAATAATLAHLTPTPATPEPDDDGWSEREWTRAEPATIGYACTHPDHDAWATPAAWMLYAGPQWGGQAACAEHLPAGLTTDGAA